MEQQNIPPRISMQTIYESILAVFNFEKGLSFTVKNLLLTPGKTLSNYLFTAEREKHIRPMNFLLLMITIATFLTLQLLKFSSPEGAVGTEVNDVMGGTSINLGEGVSQKLNDAIGILNKFFVIGMTTFIFIFTFPLAFIQMKMFSILLGATIIYMFVAYIAVFEEKNFIGFMKAIGCYFLATILHTFFIALVAGGIYLWI